jgi:RNA polymerase sigma-70 factor (ECF subfamily)
MSSVLAHTALHAASPLPASKADSDPELVHRARTGDRASFTALVDRHRERVTRTVVSMLGRSEEVDDVVQEVFIRFFETLDRFRGEASVPTYLTRIAVNHSLDALRRRKRWRTRFTRRVDEEHASVEPASDERSRMERDERTAAIHRAIATLPDAHKAVVVLRLVEGYSTEETADILNVAYGTVLSRLSRATEKLKRSLDGLLS